jgi:hypothetical protein
MLINYCNATGALKTIKNIYYFIEKVKQVF